MEWTSTLLLTAFEVRRILVHYNLWRPDLDALVRGHSQAPNPSICPGLSRVWGGAYAPQTRGVAGEWSLCSPCTASYGDLQRLLQEVVPSDRLIGLGLVGCGAGGTGGCGGSGCVGRGRGCKSDPGAERAVAWKKHRSRFCAVLRPSAMDEELTK